MGGIYFINHKTKDYILEAAGLLNLSMSTLKEERNHDSQLLSNDKHYNREDYHRKHPAGWWRSLKVPVKVLTSETYKEPSGDSQGNNTKIDDFRKKIVFQK